MKTAGWFLAIGASFFTALSCIAEVKIEEQVVGPADMQLRPYVSPHGCHVATVSQKGSRFVVTYDGVAGPRFDEVLAIPGTADDAVKVVFSQDGARYAYVGRSGEEGVIVVDGKEVGRLPTGARLFKSADSNGKALAGLSFSPNSKHYYYISYISAGGYQFIFDGQAGPKVDQDAITRNVFSSDGEHFAYVVGSFAGSQPPAVFLDNKPTGYAGENPHFTPDGKHLITQDRVHNITVDGKPFLPGPFGAMYFSPSGKMFVSVGSQNGAPFLVVVGKKVDVPGATKIKEVLFSPDEKRYAALCETKSGGDFMFIDGKKGDEYNAISHFSFSPDSTKAAYQARSGGKNFAIIGDDESDGYNMVDSGPIFGAGGKRSGFTARPAGNTISQVVIDGKVTRRDAQNAVELTFSPDGTRYAYVSGNAVASHLVVDDVDEKDLILTESPPTIAWSPDGKHITHFAYAESDSQKRGIAIDGHLIPQEGGPGRKLTFTPDGQHLLWLRTGPGQHHFIVVDGKSALQVDNTLDPVRVAGAWEMGSDGVLTFLGQVGDALKRFRVTPSSDTSVATLLASAK